MFACMFVPHVVSSHLKENEMLPLASSQTTQTLLNCCRSVGRQSESLSLQSWIIQEMNHQNFRLRALPRAQHNFFFFSVPDCTRSYGRRGKVVWGRGEEFSGRVGSCQGPRGEARVNVFAFAFWDTEMPGNVKKATAILQCTSTITKAHLQNVIPKGSH